jgi:glycosyltransferase involved in cell wall biosynthesis
VKLAFVVPRYGPEVVGGAEHAARMLAERLVNQLTWQVEVLTTCALDPQTWANEYRAGEVVIDGVSVHRFRSRHGRHPGFSTYSSRMLAAPTAATMAEAEHWLELQGPVCPEVVDAATASDADVVAYYPYLYYPTVKGITKTSERSVLHAAAHDEAALHLPIFQPTFAAARGLVFHSNAERHLVQGLFPVAERPQIVLGLGVETWDGPRHGRAEALGLEEGRPYLSCIGRVTDLKGTSTLAEFFAAYKRRRPGPLALALVGPVSVQPISHPDIVVTGAVDEAVKWDILEGSLALVSPSPFESFSIVIMEAWSEMVPVLVNGACPPTREHCERSGGGLWFESYAQFEAAVDRLVSDTALRRTLAERGRRYVEDNFRWPTVVDRYGRFLEELVGGRQR